MPPFRKERVGGLKIMTKELADRLYDRVSDVTDDVEKSEVLEHVEDLDEYGLQEDEIERSVFRKISNEYDIEYSEFTQNNSENELRTVAEAKELSEGEWLSLRVTFDEAWDESHENMSQTGLLGDETGRMKFTAWDNSGVELLEEGESYRLDNVVTEEWNGNVNIKFTKNTEVEKLDEEIEAEAGASEVELRGAFVDMQAGSGLIKRCPEDDCTRVLQNSRCNEHGEVEGEFDLRIKGVLDDGIETYNLIFNREMTESLTGIDIEEAKEMAMDALEMDVVTDEMRECVLGRYYDITGQKAGQYILVDEFEEVSEQPDVAELLNEVNA